MEINGYRWRALLGRCQFCHRRYIEMITHLWLTCTDRKRG